MILFGISSVIVGFAPNYIILIFLFMIMGAGFSCADAMMNGIIPELFPKYKNTLLPWLHAFFGLVL
jgi:MFS family permease